MDFEIIGNIEAIEIIAVGSSIRVLDYLQKTHGRGRWRKPCHELVEGLKALPASESQMEKSAVWNFTGMKRTELVART